MVLFWFSGFIFSFFFFLNTETTKQNLHLVLEKLHYFLLNVDLHECYFIVLGEAGGYSWIEL